MTFDENNIINKLKTFEINGDFVTVFPQERYELFKNKNKKVSICVPVFNAEKSIQRCLDSILEQNFQDCEILVVDNLSTDKTYSIAYEYALKNKMILVIQNSKNIGRIENWNRCLDVASGQYIKFVMVNDYLLQKNISSLCKVLDENKNVVLTRSAFSMLNNQKEFHFCPLFENSKMFTGDEAIEYCLREGNISAGPTAQMFRRSTIIENDLKFDEKLSWASDFDFAMKVLEHGDFFYLQEPLYVFDASAQRFFKTAALLSRFDDECSVRINLLKRNSAYQKHIPAILEKFYSLLKEYIYQMNGSEAKNLLLSCMKWILKLEVLSEQKPFSSYLSTNFSDERSEISYMYLVEFLIKEGRYEDAKSILSEFLKLNQDDTDALINLSVVYNCLGDNSKAISTLQNVLSIDPYNEIAIENLMAMGVNYDDKFSGTMKNITDGSNITNERRSFMDSKISNSKDIPLVSIIIPCYNQAIYLSEAVESIAQQTFSNWECIIVNDGSTDNTSDIARELIARYADKNIRLLEKSNGGLSDARNFGIKNSCGVYWLPLDADDALAPTFIEKAVKILETHHGVGFVYSHIQHFGLQNNFYYLQDFDADTVIYNDNIVCVCSLVRKSVWEEIGGYNPNMKEGYEDWDFWISCIEKGWKGYRMPEALFKYRKKENTMLSDANRKRERLIADIVINHPNLYPERRRLAAERIKHGENIDNASSSNILIACTHFWPSLGGVETIVENLGNQLVRLGYHVDVATLSRSDRYFHLYRGINIISLDTNREFNNVPLWVLQLRQLITSGNYKACILLADPLNQIIWSIENAAIPSHTRLLIQPLINKEGFTKWKDNKEFRRRLTSILQKANAVISLSRSGVESEYFSEEGIDAIYVPNATTPVSPSIDFRKHYNIPNESFLFLHVANLWPVKNHIGLFDTLHEMAGDWRLIMIGYPSHDLAYAERVREAVAKDQRVTLIPGLPHDQVSAAMKAANIFLLASHGEVSPVTILEAMSHAKPWLATTECGAVHDHAGGLIASLKDFPNVLNLLIKRPELCNKLGELGLQHWNACYNWKAVSAAWDVLVQTNKISTSFNMPLSIAESMGKVRNDIKKRLSSTCLNTPLVSVMVPTYNRPDTLKKALESIALQTYKHIEAIVVNDAGVDVSGIIDAFQGLLTIKYIVHDVNKDRSAARNTAIRHATGQYIAYLDDDDTFYPEHVETLVKLLGTTDYKVAYTDAYRAHQEKENGTYVVKQKDIPYSFDFDSDLILAQNLFPVLCVMHENSCLDEVGLFDESLTTHEDWDLWIRMSRNFRFAHIKKVTCEFTWRTDGTNMTSEKRSDFLKTLNIIYEKYKEYSKHKQRILNLQSAWIKHLQAEIENISKTVTPSKTTSDNTREKITKISVIIPVFNKVEFTQKCYEAIVKNTPRELYEVIIIDNTSTDGTKDFLKCLEGDVKVITNEKNLGFARACNQGAQMAFTDYLLFLNNDTEPKKGWLEPLLNIITQDNSVGAAGGKLLFPDGTIQHAGVVIFDDQKLPDPLVARHIYYGQPLDIAEANQLRQYQALTAACFLIRKSAFDEVGGFDEGYWNGYEDVDLCFKLQEKGWKLVYQPESVVIHHESKSGPERFSKVSENIRRLHNKWLGKITPDIIIKEDGSTIITENNKILRYSIPNIPSAEEPDIKPRRLVSLIILTWNALEYTKRCVRSIQDHTRYPHEAVFVDNASTDGTVEYLRNLVKEHPNYKLIENQENKGFAAGNNQGVLAARGEYVILLNNDVLVSDGWLEGLVESLERDKKIGMVGPITNSISGRQQVIQIPYTDEEGFYKFAQGIRKKYNGRLTPRYRVAGFAVLMRKTLYEEVNGLDESFGTGNYEDDDLCLKVREKGYAIMVDESVFIHHYRSQTFIENKINYRNNLSINGSKFKEKWPNVDYEQLLELHESLVDTNTVLCARAKRTLESGNINEAIEIYSKVLKTNPIDEAALCGLALVYQTDGKMDKTIDAYKKALQVNPSFFDAHYNLAIVYSTINQIDDAIAHLNKAINLNSGDASIHNNLGVLYFRKNMYNDAKNCFEMALLIDTHYKEAQQNLNKVSKVFERV